MENKTGNYHLGFRFLDLEPGLGFRILGLRDSGFRDLGAKGERIFTPKMGNQTEEKMDNEMETGFMHGFLRDKYQCYGARFLV